MRMPASWMMPLRTIIRGLTTCCQVAIRERVASCIVASLGLLFALEARAAGPLREGFEQWEPTWLVVPEKAGEVEFQQQRTEVAGRSGRGELIRLESSTEGAVVRLAHALPQARVLDELTASLWLRSQQPGWELLLEVTIPPGAVDPSRKPRKFTLRGTSYAEASRWQELTCQTSDQVIQQRMNLLRAQHADLTHAGPLFVERVWLVGRLPVGTTMLHIDDLNFGPIVAPDPQTVPEPQAVSTPVASTFPQVEFRLDRLQVNGQAFFPRMVPYHGESPALLKELGFNVVWIPDVNDTALIRRLWEQGLWVTATPPRPTDDNGVPLQAGTAGLLPFTAEQDPVLFWMLGTRIPGEQRQDLSHWIEQIEFADRRRARPIAADVAFDEQYFSRKLAMMGISRHALQSTMDFHDYRQWLQDRRTLARPGTFCWTWLQTEPSAGILQATRMSGQEAQLEPEQLRLQAYAAIVAGCRGLGFWTSKPLSGTTEADEEQRLAIRRLNLELKLLEPWLTTSGTVQQIPCSAAPPAAPNTARNLPFGLDRANSQEREAQLRTRAADARQRQQRDRELTAYALRSEFGQLVLPIWLEGQSQFVPAQGAIQNLTVVIPGAEQAASVFEFSTTTLRSLKPDRVAGGVKIQMPMLDEVGFLWVTSDMELVEKARQRITHVHQASADVMVQLARKKLDRVGLVDQELQSLAPVQPDAAQKLGRARLSLEQAETARDSGDFMSAAKLSGEALQLLRILQRDHWDAAVEHLSSPVSSPYTLCYQTLPAHWKLVSQFGASRERTTRNLLPSGEFEDFDTMVAENWQNVHRAPDIVQTSAALFPTGRSGRYALRLECQPQPGMQSPVVLDEPAVTVTTPPVPARVGQILHISGWVKLTTPVSASRDGLLIYDSLLGRSAGLRIQEGDQWTRFELLRVVPNSGEVTLTMSLTGMGAALIDDLQIIPHDPRGEPQSASSESEIQQTSGSKFFDRFPKLPRLVPLKPGE